MSVRDVSSPFLTSTLLFYSALQTCVLGCRAAVQLHLPLAGHSADAPPAFCDLGAQNLRCLRPNSRSLGERICLAHLRSRDRAGANELCRGLRGHLPSYYGARLPLGGRERGKAVPSLSGLSPVDLPSAWRDPLLILSIWSTSWAFLQRPLC